MPPRPQRTAEAGQRLAHELHGVRPILWLIHQVWDVFKTIQRRGFSRGGFGQPKVELGALAGAAPRSAPSNRSAAG